MRDSRGGWWGGAGRGGAGRGGAGRGGAVHGIRNIKQLVLGHC